MSTLLIKKKQVKIFNQTSGDYKKIAATMVMDFISYANDKKTLWDAITPSTLTSYAFLFHWYLNQGKHFINNKPIFLKDIYSVYKEYAESMCYDPIGKTLYLRQLQLLFDDIETKKHCMGVQIKRRDLITSHILSKGETTHD